MDELASRALADGNQVFQLGSFLRGQGDPVLVHRVLRDSGEGSAIPSSYGSRTTYQSKIDGILGPPDESVKARLDSITDLERLDRMILQAVTAASWQEILD